MSSKEYTDMHTAKVRQIKAYWRSEERLRQKWKKEIPETELKQCGQYLLIEERSIGHAAGWAASVAWARREARIKQSKAALDLRLAP